MKGVVVGSVWLVALVCLVTAAHVDLSFPRARKEMAEESPLYHYDLGEHFEGDMALPLPSVNRNGRIDERYRWPGGEAAYEFDSYYSEANKMKARQAMDRIEELTDKCITFHQRTHESSYIYFTQDNNEGCFSSVGMHGGAQRINLPQWCLDEVGAVMHEMLHALGFYHEQSSHDRDDYVTIMWENIEKGTEYNFRKYSSNLVTHFGQDYDYESLMHYSAYAFSANGKKTIVTKDPNAHIGQHKDLSQIDLKKLLKMYKC